MSEDKKDYLFRIGRYKKRIKELKAEIESMKKTYAEHIRPILTPKECK